MKRRSPNAAVPRARLVAWLDKTLNLAAFPNDPSENGLQIEGTDAVSRVAFAVDASLRTLQAACDAKAEMLVVHHGLFWEKGARRLTGALGAAVRTAYAGGLSLYAAHLPLDAHPTLGNNIRLARALKLTHLKPAFAWRGATLGFIGRDAKGRTVGVCSGGGGGFVAEAKSLGCDRFVTGEADWGDRVSAENLGLELTLAGHYETETYGVNALATAMARAFRVSTVFLPVKAFS